MMIENKECKLFTPHGCIGLNKMICEGDATNSNGKCPFYKDEETYKAGRRHVHHRLKRLGLEHLLGRRSEK